MKTITCRQMGGFCDTAFTGPTQLGVLDQATQHVMASTDPEHVKLAEQMKTMLPEDRAKWGKVYDELWVKTPDNA